MKNRLSKYTFSAVDKLAELPDVTGTMSIQVEHAYGADPSMKWSARNSDGTIDEHGVVPEKLAETMARIRPYRRHQNRWTSSIS